MKTSIPTAAFAAFLGLMALTPAARAHCDTLNGPVVQAAREALAKRDITPVLKWVHADGEAEVRAAFARTLAVRGLSPEAAELADTYFYETLVRIHRAGEGETFTRLKPAEAVDPGIEAADRALESGAIDGPAAGLAGDLVRSVKEKFEAVRAKGLRRDDSVAAGRDYVAAYVEFIHLYERLYAAAHGTEAGHEHH